MGKANNKSISETLLKDMEKKVEYLKRLVEMSSIFSSTLDLDDLIPLVMERARSHLKAEASSVLFYNNETNRLEFKGPICENRMAPGILQKEGSLEVGQGIAGVVAETLQPAFIEDVRTDIRFDKEAERFTGFPIKTLIAMPLVGRSGLIGVVEILNPRKDDYDPEIAQAFARQFAIAIENSLLYREAVERERLKQELDIASTLQKSFLPDSCTLKKGDLSVSAVNITAEKVGGDLYDFIERGEDSVGILIGDVSGKGISAALYMARFSCNFRHVAHLSNSASLALKRLNASLLKSPRGMFLTCIYLLVDIGTGAARLSVAGHPPFLWITRGQVKVMSVPGGPPLGIVPGEYPETAISLEKGDRLVLLTDGVFEAKDKSGQRLGFENLVSFIESHRKEEDLVSRMIDYVDDFAKGAEKADDLTIVELEWG
jgi:sigma-B regulation protein RsbU (phosphoserine phosphatase)